MSARSNYNATIRRVAISRLRAPQYHSIERTKYIRACLIRGGVQIKEAGKRLFGGFLARPGSTRLRRTWLARAVAAFPTLVQVVSLLGWYCWPSINMKMNRVVSFIEEIEGVYIKMRKLLLGLSSAPSSYLLQATETERSQHLGQA